MRRTVPSPPGVRKALHARAARVDSRAVSSALEPVVLSGGMDLLGGELSQWQSRRVLVLVTPSRRYCHELVQALGDREVTVFDRARVQPIPRVLRGVLRRRRL